MVMFNLYFIVVISFLKYILQPAFSEKPKILERGSYTQAAPIKEKKHFRKVSDSIGNNYSPGARHLTTSYIYETTKFGKSYLCHLQMSKFICFKYIFLIIFCIVLLFSLGFDLTLTIIIKSFNIYQVQKMTIRCALTN